VFESLQLGFHAFYLATHAGDLLFYLENLFNLSGALLKDGAEALFGITSSLQALHQVGVLLGNLFTGLRFVFHAAQRLEVA